MYNAVNTAGLSANFDSFTNCLYHDYRCQFLNASKINAKNKGICVGEYVLFLPICNNQ